MDSQEKIRRKRKENRKSSHFDVFFANTKAMLEEIRVLPWRAASYFLEFPGQAAGFPS
jgi:hypothetical protein